MKNSTIILLVLGGVFAFGVLAALACGGFLYFGFKRTDAQITPRLDQLFAAIDKGTFADTYDTDTAPEFRQVMTKEQYAEMGKTIAERLGRLKSKSISSFKMHQMNSQSYLQATYNAVFEKGPGTILVNMREINGELKLAGFRVNSNAFDVLLSTVACAACGKSYTAGAKFCPHCGVEIKTPAEAK